jgi:uncharacterized protein YbcI
MQETATQSPEKEISRGVVATYKEYLGRGATVARTEIGTDHVVTILEDGLTKAERRLISEEEEETVREIRRKFQAAMRRDIIDLVERATGRKAKSFLSDHDVHTDTAVEVVVFESETTG